MDCDDEAQSNAPKSPKGTVVISEERCKGCSYCVVFCPTNAMAMGGRLNAKGYHLPELVEPEKCNGCDMCGLFCPDFAIYGVKLKKVKKQEKDS
ncbi:MAG: 4Fe-4S dicluster domain-containing protein [Proteobacteria bacterium]|nr:4Fe-4S dicluster domain-containing protein [Pseudomonadota bacterium]